MKPLSSVMLVVTGLVASSCCCPRHARLHSNSPQVLGLMQPEYSEFDREPGASPVGLSVRRYGNPLPVVPRVQEGAYLCWAACAEMIMDFLGRHVRQCEQASRLGDPDVWCCFEGTVHKHCDLPNYPEFERWGFSAQRQYPTALSWTQVRDEIDSGRPFAFSWTRHDLNTPGNQISHMLVAVGYSQPGGPNTQMLLCLNPRAFTVPEKVAVKYSEYSGSAIPTGAGNLFTADHIHQSDYYEIEWQPLMAISP